MPRNKSQRKGPGPERRQQKTQLKIKRRQVHLQEWAAEVVKVDRCDSIQYEAGPNWGREFEYNHEERNRRCYLRAKGNHLGIGLTLELHAVHLDPSPTILGTIHFPTDDAKLSLRLFGTSALVELFIDPKKARGQPKQPGDCWAIFLRGYNDYEKKKTEEMFGRLESMAREMPDAWFNHRVFYTMTGYATDTAMPKVPATMVGNYYHEMKGGGITFTGNFASANFLQEMGVRDFRPALGQDTPNVTTRARERGGPAYMFSTMTPALKISRNDVKSVVEGVQLAVPPHQITQPLGVVAQETGSLPTAGTQGSLSIAGTESVREPSASGSEEYPIKGILEEDVNSDGESMFLVEWEGDYDPSWQPRDDISIEAMSAWNVVKETSKKSKKRKGKGRGGSRKKSKK
ncbi:MAG: hypothetical protein Q9216_002272 [Gyalolechia sp. 2 TL-2023]